MANLHPEMSVADAIDRVLEVEREAAAAIRGAEAEAESMLRAARETRRRILDRARDRATRLHVRAQARLADKLARLDAEARAAGARTAPREELIEQAIGLLARRLASDQDDSA